jgi:protein-S-isoprenylcysteine O-methyltransferase
VLCRGREGQHVTKRLLGSLTFVMVSCAVIAHFGGGGSYVRRPVGLVYLLLWALWWLIRFLGMRRGAVSTYDLGQRPMVALSGATVIPLLVIAPPWEYARYTGPIPRDGPLAWAGLTLFAGGIALQALAIRALRGLYTVRLGTQPGHRLITAGPYRLVRHPGYLSQLMCMEGIGLAMSSIAALVLTILVVPLFVWRMQPEEDMMMSEFGDEYAAYARQTRWRLIPLLF